MLWLYGTCIYSKHFGCSLMACHQRSDAEILGILVAAASWYCVLLLGLYFFQFGLLISLMCSMHGSICCAAFFAVSKILGYQLATCLTKGCSLYRHLPEKDFMIIDGNTYLVQVSCVPCCYYLVSELQVTHMFQYFSL